MNKTTGINNGNWRGGKVSYKCLVCQKEFLVWRYRARSGPKYCSRMCSDKGKIGVKHSLEHRRKMSDGIKKHLPRTVFKKGGHYSRDTEFRKGQIAWNKGQELIQLRGELNGSWKGDSVGYFALHNWIRRTKGKPLACSMCGGSKRMEWANVDHKYKRKVEDYIALCHKCHTRYDRRVNNKHLPNRNDKGVFIAGHT